MQLDVCAAASYIGLVLLVESYVEEVSEVVVYPSSIGMGGVEVSMRVINQCLTVEFV